MPLVAHRTAPLRSAAPPAAPGGARTTAPQANLSLATRRTRRIRVDAADLSHYALGLAIGFVLAAVASGPGGATIVAWQLAGAGVAGLIGVGADLRRRANGRRADRAPRATDGGSPPR